MLQLNRTGVNIAVKTKPDTSKKIRQFFLQQGIGKGVLYLTVGSILVSVLLTFLISTVFGNNPGVQGYSLAVIIPAIIVSITGHYNLNLYFDLEQSHQEIRALANTDDLTQIFNRRHFFELAKRELERSRRNSHALAIILFDIDDFKSINDSYGHLAGDFILKESCQACKAIVRPYDVFARFGGEEFIFLLPDTDTARAKAVADRLRLLIAQHVVAYNGISVRITISVGIAVFDSKKDTLDDLISRADNALYRAKRLGKNRLEVA
jgi:diguanylate cyclase (GGDEF)-like protein